MGDAPIFFSVGPHDGRAHGEKGDPVSPEHDTRVRALTQLIEPVLQAEGMALVDLRWGRRGRTWVLTLFIDREGGVTLDDCERISYQLGELIEVEQAIVHAYTLEV